MIKLKNQNNLDKNCFRLVMRAVKGVSFCMKLYTQCRVVVYPKVADSFCTYAHKEINIESLKPPNALSSFCRKDKKKKEKDSGRSPVFVVCVQCKPCIALISMCK